MKTSKSENKRLGAPEIRVAKKEELARFNRLLAEHHPNDAPRAVGKELRLVIEQGGEWIGLMLWTSACQRLRDRDDWIGWTRAQQAERLELVVQLKRYLLLHEKGERPNLASEVLAAGTRAMSSLWEQAFGYPPLLAESFSDIESYAGTCYRASGWKPVGLTKGFAKHRADCYTHHGKPKKLWMRVLNKKAVAWLRACRLPDRYAAGAATHAHGQMPVSTPQMHSLAQALRTVKDHRSNNRRFPLGAILTVLAMALLSGARDIAQIHRFCWRLSQVHRATLGFRRKPGTKVYALPSYSVFRDVLMHLDLDHFAEVLSQWLLARRGELPPALALDGKMIREVIGVVSVVDAKTGVPVAMRVMSQKKGAGARCEKRAGRSVLELTATAGHSLVTADALHTNRKTARQALDLGLDYLLQVKQNQPKLIKYVAAQTAAAPLLP